ncbi:hypothetical protein RN001_005834 [Aquatica leii]|uniref:Uncharacterized protein n=1 Tax=Aquatica leii TaxID=1421715 RepID=A0AAN7Q8C9_9COLE|nr:hypothetical protein RN001_005834 [Aquatica leii]
MDKNVFVYPVDSDDSCLDDSDDDPDFVEELESFSADSDTGSDYITDSETENISSNNQTQRRKTKIQWTHVLPENSAKVKPVWLNKLEYVREVDSARFYESAEVTDNNSSDIELSNPSSLESSTANSGSSQSSAISIEWSVEETRLLLDKYEKYLNFVGPMKKFKNMKLL